MDKVDQAIEKVNQGLSRVAIERRGSKLALRGSFPKKPGEGRGNKQRQIALGIFANPDGVKVAKAKAQRLESDLNMDRFKWSDWENGRAAATGQKTAADWAKEFGKIKAATVKETSFQANYDEPLRSLPKKPLTEEMLVAHIISRGAANTWTRKNDCMVFKQLAKFAGQSVDFSTIKGSYKPKPISPDDLPSDEEIEAIWQSITTPGWRWIYGMLATYGLRPHEVFKIADTKGISTPNGKISVMDDSKTGRRDVWPLPDKWREKFNLTEVVMPNIKMEGRNNQKLGQRISANLKKVPHTPYALRHAWAIRSAVMGVPDSIAARWMGHSVAVHAETYHAAISELQHEAIWKRANQLGNSI